MVVPPLDEVPFPTLGPQVCAFIETYLVYGPGDLRGRPVRLTDEQRALIYRMYEVYPPGHPRAGRRRFRRVGLSFRKGVGKTELAAWIAAVELHPEGPVRCDGFDAEGRPVGRPVTDPYIPMVAYTEEQTEELAYHTLYTVLAEGPLANDFDLGLTRIVRRDGSGRAVPLAAAPDARDGARTSLQVFDETHRFVLPRLREAHRTMLANTPKRPTAEPWTLEVTTAFVPGEGSVAEATYRYAQAVLEGRVQDADLLYVHRQAGDQHDLSTEEGRRAALLEASGPAASWSDLEGILAQWRDPEADVTLLERLWLNRPVQAAERAFDVVAWERGVLSPSPVADGELITLGFDGSRVTDATALVGTHVATGYQWVLGLWEQPYPPRAWEVPVDEVHAAVREAFSRYHVWRMYADPPYWETPLAEWAGEFGADRVVAWRTQNRGRMAQAVRAFATAIAGGEVRHGEGALDRRMAAHLGAAYRRYLNLRDDRGERLWTISKERRDSVFAIDLAVAAVLSWQARMDAIASGVRGGSVYEDRGLLVL